MYPKFWTFEQIGIAYQRNIRDRNFSTKEIKLLNCELRSTFSSPKLDK
jgi:hypothetical protein